MRHLVQVVMVAGLIVAATVGCEKTTAGGSDGRQVTVIKPSDITVKKGDTAQVTVRIGRKNFRDPVSVLFDSLPAGVELVDRDKKVLAEETSANFTLKAGPSALPIADQRVDVAVKASGDLVARETFKLTVKE